MEVNGKNIDWFIFNMHWVLIGKENENWPQNFTSVTWLDDLEHVIYTLWACLCIYHLTELL